LSLKKVPIRPRRQLTDELKKIQEDIENYLCGKIGKFNLSREHLICILGYLSKERYVRIIEFYGSKNDQALHEIRSVIFGFDSAYFMITENITKSEFNVSEINKLLCNPDLLKTVNGLIEEFKKYAWLRDCLLTYRTHGYEYAIQDSIVSFSNPDDFPGYRDAVNRELFTVIDQNRVEKDDYFKVMETLRLGQLSGVDYFNIRMALINIVRSNIGRPQIISLSEIVRQLTEETSLPEEIVRTYIECNMQNTKGDGSLTIQHRPFIELSKDYVFLSYPALLIGDPETILPRLYIKTDDNNEELFSENAEEFLINRILEHLDFGNLVTRKNVKVSDGEGEFEIDIICYYEELNTVIISEVKAFIKPDTVMEVWAANERISEGIGQIKRRKAWFETLGIEEIKKLMEVDSITVKPEPKFVLLTNSFCGSDYLEIPDDISIVNIEYILMQKYKGCGLETCIKEFEDQFEKEYQKIKRLRKTSEEFQLGGYTINVEQF